jgi:hypothetical protein
MAGDGEMKNPNHALTLKALELCIKKVKKYAEGWAKDFRALDKLTLCVDKENSRYLFIALYSTQDETEWNRFRNWTFESCMHIQDVLLECDPEQPFDGWAWYSFRTNEFPSIREMDDFTDLRALQSTVVFSRIPYAPQETMEYLENEAEIEELEGLRPETVTEQEKQRTRLNELYRRRQELTGDLTEKAEAEQLAKERELHEAETERQRLDAIRAKITDMQRLTANLTGKTTSELQAISKKLFDLDITEEVFQEFTQEAEKMKMECQKIALDARESRMKQDAEDAARKAEDERLRKEKEAQEAEAKQIEEAKAKLEDEKKTEEPKNMDGKNFSHSDDFRSVIKNRVKFSLTSRQAEVIQKLYNAHDGKRKGLFRLNI